MKSLAILSIAALLAGSLQAETPHVAGTLPEDLLPGLKPLLRAAVERSPSAIAADLTVEVNRGGKYQAYAPLYPSVNLSATYQETVTTESHSTNRNSGPTYTLYLNQPIFQWGALKNGAEMGKLGLKIAERQYAEAYRLLAVSIREQYMLLITKKITLRNEQFRLKISNEQLEAQQARLNSGASSPSELQSFQIAVQQQQLAVDRAAEDYGYAKQVFTRLVGVETIDDPSIPTEIPHPEYSSELADAVLADFSSGGVNDTFQSQIYQMQITQQDRNYDVQKVRLLPKFNVSAEFLYENYVEAAPHSVSQVFLQEEIYSVGANWSLFDGFATRGAKISALANKRTYERQKKTYVDSSIDAATYMRHQLSFSSRALALSELQNRLVEDEVKRIGNDKGMGFASQASLDTGTLNLYATEFDMSFARSDYLSKWTEFVSLVGNDPSIEYISPRYVR